MCVSTHISDMSMQTEITNTCNTKISNFSTCKNSNTTSRVGDKERSNKAKNTFISIRFKLLQNIPRINRIATIPYHGHHILI